MKKVKLPRKRKKAMIKAKGWQAYLAATIVGEILCKDHPERDAYHRKYPKTGYIKYQKYIVTSWW